MESPKLFFDTVSPCPNTVILTKGGGGVIIKLVTGGGNFYEMVKGEGVVIQSCWVVKF